VANYRGISKLSAIPKLFESVISDQLAFNIQPFITPYQHGFMTGKSTTTKLDFVNYVLCGFENNLSTDVLFADCTKAFDRVLHELLVFKSNCFGLSEKFCLWLESYLSGRSQCVLFKNCKSNVVNVLSGVPQGSHLGPLLFLIFINDLPNAILNSKILIFADDIKLYLSHVNNSLILQNDINNFSTWCSVNKLQLNISKCKIMTFSRSAAICHDYHLNGFQLEKVCSFVDLGVTLDPKLRFHFHIEKIVNKATCTLGFIKRWAKEFLDPYATVRLYTALVRPILEYASVVWNPQYQSYSELIESVQKQFLLFCLRGLNWDPSLRLPSYESRLKLIHLPTLYNRRKLLNVCFVFNVLNGSTNSSSILNFIRINIPSRPSRYYTFIKLSYYTKNYLNFNPLRIACNDFNELYDLIDFSLSSFQLKKIILEHLE